MSLQRHITRCYSLISKPIRFQALKASCSAIVSTAPQNKSQMEAKQPLSSRFILQQRYYSTEPQSKWEDEDFKKVLNENKLVVFMKGTPDAPQCGFSKYVIQILYMHGCEDYKTFNVLDDDVMRNRVKEFSDWPTIPQIYINGEFVGGFDILLQMHQGGDLIEELEKIGHRSLLIDADKTEK